MPHQVVTLLLYDATSSDNSRIRTGDAIFRCMREQFADETSPLRKKSAFATIAPNCSLRFIEKQFVRPRQPGSPQKREDVVGGVLSWLDRMSPMAIQQRAKAFHPIFNEPQDATSWEQWDITGDGAHEAIAPPPPPVLTPTPTVPRQVIKRGESPAVPRIHNFPEDGSPSKHQRSFKKRAAEACGLDWCGTQMAQLHPGFVGTKSPALPQNAHHAVRRSRDGLLGCSSCSGERLDSEDGLPPRLPLGIPVDADEAAAEDLAAVRSWPLCIPHAYAACVEISGDTVPDPSEALNRMSDAVFRRAAVEVDNDIFAVVLAGANQTITPVSGRDQKLRSRLVVPIKSILAMELWSTGEVQSVYRCGGCAGPPPWDHIVELSCNPYTGPAGGMFSVLVALPKENVAKQFAQLLHSTMGKPPLPSVDSDLIGVTKCELWIADFKLPNGKLSANFEAVVHRSISEAIGLGHHRLEVFGTRVEQDHFQEITSL
eukprot:gnl/MRDRNA2_/MRDRNA2_18434_c0_seq1.p1 gnl/MRDRNA2_/MRDRNA2_18434_c0~~gnl/MRDRNA2_/MRDRNA2_18434_c0_seq1.p1  ORF type:complete len:485 (+),score=82.17 gnl/MRDRNA2_/MRDRNA2_18434_c0_seq1:79-1533(+)